MARGHRHDHAHGEHDHAHGEHDHAHGEHAHGEHDHGHHARGRPARRLAAALAITASFMVFEALAGLWSGSLALLSDAGHMLSDTGALTLALAAQRVADRPRTRTWTFGLRRAETLAALANAAALGATAVFIVVEAVRRLGESHPVLGAPMAAVATAGLLVNLGAAWILGGGHETNANVRAALAHVLSDAAGSVAAMLAAGAILGLGWLWADPVSSLVIAALIAIAAWRLVGSTAGVLLEGAPAGLDVRALERTICETPGVAGVHDLHAWRIEEGFDAVSAHVVLAPGAHGVEVAEGVARRIQRAHHVEHVTIQPEAPTTAPVVPLSALRKKDRG